MRRRKCKSQEERKTCNKVEKDHPLTECWTTKRGPRDLRRYLVTESPPERGGGVQNPENWSNGRGSERTEDVFLGQSKYPRTPR